MKRILHRLLPLTLISAIPFVIAASYPSWWYERGAVMTNGVVYTNDFAAINAGQVKTLAVKAAQELEAHLPGGAGPAVQTLVNSFQNTNNYAAVNAGQVKNVAVKFHDRLIAAGYTNAYPWANSPNPAKNYAPVNIGQVKNLFAFDVTKDADADGLPDWWERAKLGGVNAWTAVDDPDADGFVNAYEFRYGTDPTNSQSIPPEDRWIHVSLSGSHIPPFTNWVTAATNLAGALAVATNPCNVVTIADGVYRGALNRNLTAPAAPTLIRSQHGAAACVVDCQTNSRAFVFGPGCDRRWMLVGVTIQGGYAPSGGGLYVEGGSPVIRNCVIRGNTAEYRGGGLDCYSNATPLIQGCRIVGNVVTCSSNGFGGGISCRAGSAAGVVDCVVASNRAAWDGGGLDADRSSPGIERCTFEANEAIGHGGGAICLWDGAAPTIWNCTIASNSAAQGGGVYVYGIAMLDEATFSAPAAPNVRNCLVVRNQAAGRGGGFVFCPGTAPQLESCTVVENRAGEAAGGLVACGGEIWNSIVWGNDPEERREYGSGLLWTHCCTTASDIGFRDGGGNVTNQWPGFASGEAYRLSGDSECVNAGENRPWMDGARDLDGNERVVCGAVDIGAFEVQE